MKPQFLSRILGQSSPSIFHGVRAFILIGIFASSAAQASPPKSIWGFIGVSPGYSNLQSDLSGEDNKHGHHTDLKLLGSAYFDNWVVDFGAGWFYNRMQSIDDVSPDFVVISRAGLVELSPRFLLGPNWQLGPVFNWFFGTDVKFSQSVGPQTSSLRGGARLEYDWMFAESYRTRAGIQLMTDLTIADRQVYWVQLDFQFGIPFWDSARPQVEVEKTQDVIESVQGPVRIVGETTVVISLNESDIAILFDTAKSSVKPKFRVFLKELSEYSTQNSSGWDEASIEGHADQRGSKELNVRLSLDRARSVQDALIQYGIPVSRMRVRGYGSTQPLAKENTPEAWRVNRRVEIQFFGVKAPETVSKEITEIWEKHFPQK